ncbi:MAG TPA: class I SAM-dependent methyltransferase [Pseudonocardiaceae bacterium]|nr:class I SAM-dependent methyltransferase [Pseudonocardiaceae bacterium]
MTTVNHHADHPGFAGVVGLLAGLSMIPGRGAVARLVADSAPVMLRLARALTRQRAGITWAEGSAEDLRQPEASATVLWCVATVHHWKDVSMGLAEARRVLAPEGRLLVIERCVHPRATGLASHGWTEQQVQSFAAQCRAAGFDDVRVEQHTPGRRALYVVRAVRR